MKSGLFWQCSSKMSRWRKNAIKHVFLAERPSEEHVERCGYIEIVRVRVTSVTGKALNYQWAWWNNRLGRFTLICETYDELSSCFRDIQAAQSLGEGKAFPVTITELPDEF